MEAKDKQLKMSKTSKTSSTNDVQTSDHSVREKKIVEITDKTTSTKTVEVIDKISTNVDKNEKSLLKSTNRDDTKKGSTPPAKKIKSYDYAAWEKFDVDKALVNFTFTSYSWDLNNGNICAMEISEFSFLSAFLQNFFLCPGRGHSDVPPHLAQPCYVVLGRALDWGLIRQVVIK